MKKKREENKETSKWEKRKKIRETLLTRTCENRGENPIMHFVDGSPNQVQFLASFQGGGCRVRNDSRKTSCRVTLAFSFPGEVSDWQSSTVPSGESIVVGTL